MLLFSTYAPIILCPTYPLRQGGFGENVCPGGWDLVKNSSPVVESGAIIMIFFSKNRPFMKKICIWGREFGKENLVQFFWPGGTQSSTLPPLGG